MRTGQELDAQSPVKIDRWIDVDSEECKDMDETPDFTRKIMRIGFEDGWLFTDLQGRIWGHAKNEENGPFFPFHFEWGSQLIGYRISKRAAN